MENKCKKCKYAVQSRYLELEYLDLCTLGNKCEYQAREDENNEL